MPAIPATQSAVVAKVRVSRGGSRDVLAEKLRTEVAEIAVKVLVLKPDPVPRSPCAALSALMEAAP